MKIAYITTGEARFLDVIKDAVTLVITNNFHSSVVQFCKREGIRCRILDHELYASRDEHELAIKDILDKAGIDLVILGSYRRIIKNIDFLKQYSGKIINIHLSYLPEFPGERAWEKVFLAGTKESGYTLHYVDTGIDTGKIIFQERVNIEECKNSQEVYDKLVEATCIGLRKVIENL